MTKSNLFVFIVLQVMAWLIFTGLCIEAFGLLVNFFFSLYNPDVLELLYNKLDLQSLRVQSDPAFFGMYTFALMISFLKVVLFYIVILLATKLNLNKPFNSAVAKKITWMSYCTFSIGFFSAIAQALMQHLEQRGYPVNGLIEYWVDSQAFILMAAVIFLISIIFKRGVELQTENDLTV